MPLYNPDRTRQSRADNLRYREARRSIEHRFLETIDNAVIDVHGDRNSLSIVSTILEMLGGRGGRPPLSRTSLPGKGP